MLGAREEEGEKERAGQRERLKDKGERWGGGREGGERSSYEILKSKMFNFRSVFVATEPTQMATSGRELKLDHRVWTMRNYRVSVYTDREARLCPS